MNFLGFIKNGNKGTYGLQMPAFYPASRVSYDNTSSRLTASNAQDAIDEVVGRVRTDFNFAATVDSDGAIITDVPLNGWLPIGVVPSSLSRIGWGYYFVTDINKSSNYWYIKPIASGTPSGQYAGRIVAMKI